MLSAYNIGPIPSATSRGPSADETNSGRNMRESIGILFGLLISLAVLFSSICIFKYALRDRAVYEELVDYLDKTVSISKINYNPALGIYELRVSELDTLGEQRKYKSIIWTFLFSDLACFLFFAISAFFFFSAETSRGIIRFLFWFFLAVGSLYSLLEATTFAVLLSPYSAKLPNATIALMDHAVPFNPGGLAQMENRFGCIFDQNLYETFRRQLSPRNTCDPFLLSSFVPTLLLVSFVVLRGLALLLFLGLMLAPNSAPGKAIARAIAGLKPAIRYKKNDGKTAAAAAKGLPSYYASPSKTTFGVKEHISSPLPTQIPPVTPPLGQMDHSISYNNAALFAISGANVNYGMMNGGGGSSRCSDISATKCDNMAADLALRGSIHTSHSLVSEV